MKSLFVQGRHR